MDESKNKDLKILMIADKKHFKYNNKYYSKGGFYLQMNYFGSKIPNLNLMIPVKNSIKKPEGNPLENINVIELPLFNSILELIKSINTSKSKIKNVIKKHDIIVLRIPSFYSLFSYFISKKFNKKIIFIIVGDWEIVASDFFKNKFLSKLYSLSIRTILKNILKKNILIVTGEKLKNKYQTKYNYCKSFISSSITNKEIITKNNINNNIKIILFVGRISKEKGLKYLVKAIEKLNNEREKKNNCQNKFSLILVGEIIDYDYFNKYIKNKDFIKFKGMISNRKELNKIYLNSDLFVLPSIIEGTPKVLLEAMSKSIPVIATRVGGIPSIITNRKNGLLINPNSDNEIKKAILELNSNVNLRSKLISEGINTAKTHTLETELDKIIEIIYS